MLLLWHLSQRILRFNEIGRIFPDISTKMLTQQLRDMEEDGLILRKVYPQVPPKVEYDLTDFGRSLIPVLMAMQEWGTSYVNDQKQKTTESK